MQPGRTECKVSHDIVAVVPFTNSSACTIQLKSLDVTIKVKRKQMPFVCAGPITLHDLQGSTRDPGLVFHWTFSPRMESDLVWLAEYVALSRVRRLSSLKSVGMGIVIKKIVQKGVFCMERLRHLFSGQAIPWRPNNPRQMCKTDFVKSE